MNRVSLEQHDRLIELGRIGARKVLSQCLSLNSGDVLALFWDETTSESAAVLADVARELGIVVINRYVTLAEQQKFSQIHDLSLENKEALEQARGIITCVSNHMAGTPYRSELLRIGTTGGKCFGHMPGATLAVLAHAVNIDYSIAIARCDNLALALTQGQMAHLQSYIFDAGGKPIKSFDLNFQLGGLIRSPITSTGIIPLGTWGNLPGGETFIAPIEDTAEGTFVLNGAFKNKVIQPPDYLLLNFSKGRLVDVKGSEGVVDMFTDILKFARSLNDKYYDSLAELGIGVNTGIKELTGNALFDEKCSGTAHIAIGDNTRYGGHYYSRIHEDLITRSPSIWIDGKPILSMGADAFDSSEWRESLTENTFRLQIENPDLIVTRTAIYAEKTFDEQLRVRRSVAAGRICIYTVGNQSSSRVLAHVYTAMVPSLPNQIGIQELLDSMQSELKLSVESAKAAVSILLRHGLVDLREMTQDIGKDKYHE